jgi:hypothetical protein
MTKQSEALWLATVLEAQDLYYDRQAAAELRRLHELNQELLEALLRIMRHVPTDFGGASFSDDWWKAKRIIAKATGEQQ